MEALNRILSLRNLTSVDGVQGAALLHLAHQMQQQQLQQQQLQQHQLQQHQLQQQEHQHQLQNQRNQRLQGTNSTLIDLITCKLCKGYLIDAATIDLCMHSFCRPCAVKYMKDKPSCPECNLEIKDKRFLNRLKTDVTKQNIVYKLVPGLYEREMARRRKFYAQRPSPTARYKSEMFGNIPPSKTIRPDDMLNVGITWLKGGQEETIKTYFHCRADSTILVLKKLLTAKFGLDRPIKIYYGNSEIIFDWLTTLTDVAATFNWAPANKILDLSFKEDDEADNKNAGQFKMVEDKKAHINSLSLMESDLGP